MKNHHSLGWCLFEAAWMGWSVVAVALAISEALGWLAIVGGLGLGSWIFFNAQERGEK